MNTKAGLLILVSGLLAATYTFFPSSEQQANKRQDIAVSLPGEVSKISHLQKRIEILENENRDLRRKLIPSQARNPRPDNESEYKEKTINSDRESGQQETDMLALSEVEAIERIKKTEEWLSNQSEGQSVDEKLEQDFSEETRDSDWAFSYEDKIYTSLAQNEALNNINWGPITCKSSRCQIEAYTHNIENYNEISQLFSEQFSNGSMGLEVTQVLASLDRDTGIIKLYIGRNSGDSLVD